MLRRDFLALAGAGLWTSPFVPTIHQPFPLFLESIMQNANSGFAPVNGLNLYYEIHGAGQPLILLHGGVSASEAFGPNLKELAKSRKVIAVHLQGHGHTKDINRPLRFESMADDVAALIAFLKIEKADVLGYSVGGGVALQTAIRHPAAVNRLVVVSAAMQQDGWFPEVITAFDQLSMHAPQIAQNIKGSPLGQLYPEVNWETLLRKIGEMESQDFDWSEQVKKLQSPMMLVFADADAIRPEHMVEFYKALGGGQRDAGLDGSLRSKARLGIVPGATHYNILATTAVTGMVSPFLSQA
ncbi:MAG TPA: alpha/beta hydrolase [Edaphobacter sp.]|nr:alpha/beta hydrolase [Edaphobacter sp.]